MSNSIREITAELESQFPFRSLEIETVCSVLNNPSAVPTVLIYGHSSTGKTSVVKAILSKLQLVHAYLNCTECTFNIPMMFSELVCQLSEQLGLESPADAFSKCRDADCVNEFVDQLKLLLSAADESPTITLVFDNAERLCQLPSSIFLSLLKLDELTNFKINLIFISVLPFTKFQHRSSTSQFSPVSIFFRSYTNDELAQIMLLDHPSEFPALYAPYCRLIVNILSPVCRDLNELRYIAMENFSKYTSPIELGEIQENEPRKLYRAFEPTLKQCAQKPFLREITSSEPKILREAVEFPLNTKLLLISAYLASYHPPAMDRRLFALNYGKTKRTARVTQQQRNEKERFFAKGPRVFTLDRLLAIFGAVLADVDGVERNAGLFAELLNQVASLCALGFLIQMGVTVNLDSPKYKCSASREFVQSIAKNVGFALEDYLLEQRASGTASANPKIVDE